MGVNGLWNLVEAAGKPVALESLENKVLAVDVSIWLNQAVKGLRDRTGAALPNAHVLGLFHRVCKLLFYRIRPVFVFDGPPPQLKRDTLAGRRRRKGRAKEKSDAARARIIENFLRAQAVRAAQLRTQSQAVGKVLDGGAERLAELLNKRNKAREKDLFELPPLPEGAEMSDDDEEDDVLSRLEIDRSMDIHQFDLHDDRFNSLPSHQQAEVLIELREKRKQNSWAKLGEMPREAQSFSGFQLERLKKRSAMQKRLDVVGNQATEEQSTLLDHKLFVGDRAALKAQRKKKQIIGRDFVFLETEKVPDKSADPVPGTSKEDPSPLSDDGGGEELSQEQILATIQSGFNKADAALSSSEEEENLLVEPSEKTVLLSRRCGGTTNIIKPETDADEASARMSSSDSDDDEEDGFLEVTVDSNASAPDDEEEDIFADVFADAGSHGKLDELMQAFRTERSDAKRSAAKEDQEEANKKKKEEEPDLASSMKEKGHLFLQIAARWAEESQKSKEEEDDDKKKKKSDKSMEKGVELDRQLEKDTESLLSEMREIENKERLLRAVRPGISTANLAKTSPALLTSPSISSAREGEKTGDEHEEEKALLEDMGVSVFEKGHYDSGVLPKDGPNPEPEEDDDLVYGSSAPGFIRSSRNSNQKVVEVKEENGDEEEENGDDDNDGELGAEILRKLEDTESEKGLLSREDLARIQRDLARDQRQLVAERGRQDRMASSVSDQMYADCQELLQLFGLPWIVAPSEAEAQCAFLDVNGLTHGTITDDSDIWVFGGQKVYKHFFNQERHCEVYSAADLAKHFGLSREQMISVAMMTGSDYTDGLENVGPVTSMEILAEFAGIGSGMETLVRFRDWLKEGGRPESSVREKLRKIKLPQNFPNSRIADAYLSPEVDNSLELFSWAVPNLVEISDFAQEKFGWSRHKVDEIIKPVIRKLNSGASQARIDNYFQLESVRLPEKGRLQKSKRVHSAIDKVLGRRVEERAHERHQQREGSTRRNRKDEAVAKHKVVKPPTSKKEEEAARKKAAKEKAIEIYKKVGGRKRQARTRLKPPKRIVLEKHNLSESDSD